MCVLKGKAGKLGEMEEEHGISNSKHEIDIFLLFLFVPRIKKMESRKTEECS